MAKAAAPGLLPHRVDNSNARVAPASFLPKNAPPFGPSQLAMRHFVFLIAIFASLIADLRAAEPFFKPNDVVALVGGEDMVVAAELGYLETLIQLALPDHHLKFRSLAREGDTVFEQRRDLNYPKLEDQLDKMGATVVICQFGQMESLAAAAAVDGMDRVDALDKVDTANGAGTVQEVHKVQAVHERADAARKAKVAEFVATYEKLIGRLKGKDGARRIAIVQPAYRNQWWEVPEGHNDERAKACSDFAAAISDLATKCAALYIDNNANELSVKAARSVSGVGALTNLGHRAFAEGVSGELVDNTLPTPFGALGVPMPEHNEAFAALIAAKNRLWYYYYRPQNWAFLAGDRTNQPSSRDHLDPSKRWFPEELEKFVPLIDAKDAEIWALAKKLK